MPEPAGDLDVDVLIVGGGVVGHYLAAQLTDRYTVCLLTDPDAPDESLASDGLLGGGYDGNDVAHIQPARRSAGYWRLWAEANDVPFDEAPSIVLVPADEEVARVRFWLDAALHVVRLDEVPAALRGGTAAGSVAFRASDDVVIDPGAMVRRLRHTVERSCVDGRVVDLVLAADGAVDAVDAEIDGAIVPIVARFTVFADDASNADLLAKVAARTRDSGARRERAEIARTCQAVRKQLQLRVRGPDLPLVTAWFDDLHLVAHRLGDDVVWLVSPPVDDTATTLGAEDLRFVPQVDRNVVAGLVRRLLDASPLLAEQVSGTEWSVGAIRRTEHPVMAGDLSGVGRPSPARIESMGLEGFAAVWPGHVSYSMIIGDVIAERVASALGRGGGFDPDEVAALAAPERSASPRSVYASDAVDWLDWATFHARFGS